MKPKEYLVSIGAIEKAGRGRLSADHKALIEKAVSEGVKIEGYETVKSTGPTNEEKPATVRRVENNNEIQDTAPIHYPEDDFVAYEYVDGKKVERSMRSACNICRVSLVQNVCESPRIVARNGGGSVPVTIVRR